MSREKETKPQLDNQILTAMVDKTADFICTASPDEKVLFINKAGRLLIGLDYEDEITDFKLMDLFPAPAIGALRAGGIPAARSNGAWTGETILCGREGKEIPVSIEIICCESSGGSTECLAMILRDISGQKQSVKGLLESKNTYHAIFENTGTATVIIEEDFTISMVNREFELISGFTRDQIENKMPWMDFIDDEDLSRMMEYHRKRRIDPQSVPEKYEFAMIDRRGIRKNVYLTIRVIPGTRKYLASIIDITVLKEAREKIRQQFDEIHGQYEKLEKLNEALKSAHGELLAANYRLRDSEERFRSLVQTIPHGVIECDLGGIITFVNRTQATMTGYREEELVGNSIWDYLSDEDERNTYQKKFSLERQDNPDQFTVKSRTIEGSEIFIRVDWNYRRDNNGKLISLVAVVTDITAVRKAKDLLRISEEKFSRAFHVSPTMMLITDIKNGIIEDVNDSFLKFLEAGRIELLGRKTLELGFWENEAERNIYRKKILLNGSLQNVEKEFKTKNGTPVTGLFSAEIITVENRHLLLVVGTDITDRLRVEKDLRKSERNFSKVFSASPDAIGISRLSDATYIEVNDSALNMSGYTREEVIGKTPGELGIFANYRDYLRFLSILRHNNSVNKMEFTFRNKKGDVKIGIVSAEPIEFSGEPCLITSILDITERKSAEQELAAERERLAITLRSIGDGVITTDIQGRVVLINKIAEELTGYTQDEARGEPLDKIFSIINERTRKTCEDPVVKVLRTGSIVGLANHTALISKGGTERIIADSAAPIRDKEGVILGVILVFRDITEKKKIEEGLIKAQRLESLGVLAGGIAHDFNNILTAILGNINLAKLQARGEKKMLELLSDAEGSSLRARDLTQQLLTFARGGKPVKKIASIEKLLRETATFTLRGSNILCTFRIADDLQLLEFDEGQMGQVVNNLVINAKQAMPRGGIITITAENLAGNSGKPLQLKDGRYVKITIGDEGVGIPDYNIPNIFDPYFTTKENGSGLGLTTTYSIIMNHDGFIDVNSRVNTGTVFTIFLPATGSNFAIAGGTEEKVKKGKGRLLFLDDEDLVINVAKKMIRFMGYDVVCVKSGDEVIAAYQKAAGEGKSFDAVMLDLTIPGGMGGKDVIKILKELDPNVKAIVSSGYSNDPIMAEFRNYGFSGVANKPYRIEELSNLLYSLIVSKEVV